MPNMSEQYIKASSEILVPLVSHENLWLLFQVSK